MATQPTTQIAEVVGANIAAARKAKGLTQLELAAELGTSISRVSGWETGNYMPSQRYQQALAELLFGGTVAAMYEEPEGAAA